MNFKKALIFTGCATPVCALLNCLIMFFTIESESGFFRLGYDAFAIFMLCLIATLTLISAVTFSRISRPAAPKFQPILSCIASLILGICLIVDVVKFVPLVGTTAVFVFLIRLFGILSGVVFIWRAISCIFSIKMVKSVYIIPVLYYLSKVISTFIAYAGVATITETVFELLAICAMLIFTLNFAKVENGISGKKGNPLYLPVSVACAIVIISQIAPYVVNHFAQEKILIHANSLFIPTSLALFLFIAVNVIFDNKEKSEKGTRKYESGTF